MIESLNNKIIREHQEAINTLNKSILELYNIKSEKEHERINNNYNKFNIPNDENYQIEYIKNTIKNDSLVYQIKEINTIIDLLNEKVEYETKFIEERR